MNAWRNTLRAVLTMMVFSVLFTALMAVVFSMTHTIVLKNEQDATIALLEQVLPQGSYDNDLLHTAIKLSQTESQALGNDKESLVYVAKKNGRTQNIIVEATAPDGYGGKIKLLINVNCEGLVQAVRVLTHKETPGLGDYIEFPQSNWILQFNGTSLHNPRSNRWHVKKDGGEFDYVSGATITARAIVKAVHRVLQLVTVEHQRFFGDVRP